MAKNSKFDPFPPLDRDGHQWRTSFALPWFATENKPDLVVHSYASTDRYDVDDPPQPPSVEQIAAFCRIAAPDSTLPATLLPRFKENVPELAEADWGGVQEFFELAALTIFRPAHENEAYVGLVFNCLQWEYGYEHGIGVVTHKERVVHFNMAEEAYEDASAVKDLKRIARDAKRKR